MQLAEIHLLQGTEHERAADMYERAIYAMECAFHSAFKPWRVESAAAGGGGGGGNQPRLPFAVTSLRAAVVARRPAVFNRTPAEAWVARRTWLTADHHFESVDYLADVVSGAVNWNWDAGGARCDATAADCSTQGCAACHGDAAHQRPLRNLSSAAFFRRLREEGQPLLYYSPIDR